MLYGKFPQDISLQQPRGIPHHVDRHVGRQVAALRTRHGVTQAQLASAIGISFQQLQKYECAKNRISASMLFKIASFFSVPVGDLFDGLIAGESGDDGKETLPGDQRIFVEMTEERSLIEGLMQLPPGIRRRVLSLISALGEQFRHLDERYARNDPSKANPPKRLGLAAIESFLNTDGEGRQ